MIQRQLILNYLLSGKSINQWKCYNLFRASRLSAIIWKLEREGYTIKKERQPSFNGKTSFVEYTLVIPEIKFDFE